MARSHLLTRIGLLCYLVLSVLAQSDKLVFCHFMVLLVGHFICTTTIDVHSRSVSLATETAPQNTMMI